MENFDEASKNEANWLTSGSRAHGLDCNEASNLIRCFNSSYPDISDTIPANQRLFYFLMAQGKSLSDWLVHLKKILCYWSTVKSLQPHCQSWSGLQWSLKLVLRFFLFMKQNKADKHFLDGAVVIVDTVNILENPQSLGLPANYVVLHHKPNFLCMFVHGNPADIARCCLPAPSPG